MERTLECPKCDDAMAKREEHDVTIDYCTDCGGVWLDPGELSELTGSHGSHRRDIDIDLDDDEEYEEAEYEEAEYEDEEEDDGGLLGFVADAIGGGEEEEEEWGGEEEEWGGEEEEWSGDEEEF